MASAPTTPWLQLIRFAGDDRISFLQGQLTQDVAQLGEDRPAMLAASCDPKGRVIAVLTLIHTPDAVLAAVRSEIADMWLSTILRYKLRAKLTAEVVADQRVMRTLRSQQRPAEVIAMWQFGECQEALVNTDESNHGHTDDWREARLHAGIIDIADHAIGSFTPHMLNLDTADAISFNKGCYTGQEVVARTQHLGAVKRRVRLLHAEALVNDTQSVAIMGDGRKVGRVVAGAGHTLAAVISTNDIDLPLTLEDGSALSLIAKD